MADISNIVLLHAQDGKAADLGKALSDLVSETRKEAGCAVTELNQSNDDPNVWMVYERWRGKDAFDSHMKQPYVTKFLGRLGDLLSHSPEVRPFTYRG
jgi:quinol monooxygenase YgiN